MLWRKPGERVDVLTLVKDLPSSKSDPSQLTLSSPAVARSPSSADLKLLQVCG